MSRTIGGAASSYAWDVASGLPVILKDSQGSRYVHGLDLISRTDGGNVQEYHLYDGLGSTTGLADGSGAVTGGYQYDAFGNVRAQTGATTEWSFTGEQNDPTGLEYLRARYYDSATGRLLSRDPLPLLQRYPYVNNNPVRFVDPSGLCKKTLNPWDLGKECAKKTINCVSDISDCAQDAAGEVGEFFIDQTYDARTPLTRRIEAAVFELSSGDVQNKEGGIRLVTNCRGLCGLVQADAFAIGRTIFTKLPTLNAATLQHEKRHVRQYEVLGDLFWAVYLGNSAGSSFACLGRLGPGDGDFTECVRDTNILEILAGD